MYQHYVDWIANNHIGSIASIVGVVISLVGFAATLVNVSRSKNAAKRAEYAAIEAQNSAKLFDTVSDVSKAISIMDEVKRLNRAGQWTVILDRYSEIRKILIAVKVDNPNLSEDQMLHIQTTLGHLTGMENAIEEALENESTQVSISRTNMVISREIEKLQTVLVEVKANQGT